ncbi:hypothetical protein QFZ94_008488 [Paraburkholderia sp. JPY465]
MGDRLFKEPPGSDLVPPGPEQEFDRVASLVHCPVKIFPLAFDLDIALVHSPAFPNRTLVLQPGAAFDAGVPQDRHRSIAQLSGGESKHPGTAEREACVRQGGGPCQHRAENSHQPTRERRMRGFRAPGLPVELQSDPAALCTGTTFAALLSIANTSGPGFSRGANLPTSSKLRRLASEPPCVVDRHRRSQPS